MQSNQSIRFRVHLIVGLLVAVLVAICAVSAEHAFERRRQAHRVMTATQVSRDLFTAMNALRLERGATDGLLATAGVPTPTEQRYQSNMRANAAETLKTALSELAAVAPNDDRFRQSGIAPRLAEVSALRTAADAAERKPIEQRPPGLGSRWLDAATALTSALAETAGRMDAEIGQSDPFIARMLNIGQLAWSARAAAGTDSLLWGRDGIIGRPLSPEQRDQFNALVGQVDALWASLQSQAADSQAPPQVMAAIGKANRVYFRQDRTMRAGIIDALIAGRQSPTPPMQQRILNTAGLESLMAVASAAFEEAAARAAHEAAEAQRQFYAAIAVMVLAVGFGLTSSLFVSAMVLQPIGRITTAMQAVAEGDLAREIPDIRRRDEVGELARALGVFRSNALTKRTLDEELLKSRIAKETAEASARAKAEFLANMSHEIRTPLTSVIGFAGLMAKMPDLPDKARTHVKRILTGGQALHSLVNDILDFSRIEAGQVELDPQPLALERFLFDTVELVRPEAEKKALALSLELTNPMADEILVDAERVRQVLLNLIGNAIKFTPQGSVTVNASYQSEASRLLVKVRDTGVGISPEHGDRLFQRFSQIDASNTRRYGGVGLGLAISKGLVDLMGGEIGVERGEGPGSTFWFSLAAPPVRATASPEDANPPSVNIGPLHILVVDDVAMNRELVTAMLSPYALRLSEAANGAEAVEAAGRDSYDLILMDLQMPVMDGLAAARAIRASALNAATPILAVSANVMDPQVEACAAAGMNDHIAKPIDSSELLSKIGRWAAPAGAGA